MKRADPLFPQPRLPNWIIDQEETKLYSHFFVHNLAKSVQHVHPIAIAKVHLDFKQIRRFFIPSSQLANTKIMLAYNISASHNAMAFAGTSVDSNEFNSPN